MSYFIFLTAVLLAFLLPLTGIAQENQKINISPPVVDEIQVEKCKKLNLGRAAISVPPKYPNEAKSAGVGGIVKVKVQIDEKGNVVDILDVNGHRLLKNAASEAANRVKFTPTICDGIPKPITGVIKYSFTPYVFNSSYFAPESAKEFVDVSTDSNYYEAVFELTDNYKLGFGFRDKKFHPGAPITKGEFAHFLRTTLDLLHLKAEQADKVPDEIGFFRAFNPKNIRSAQEIADFTLDRPYAKSLVILISKYRIALIDDRIRFAGNLPLTQNEVIDYWTKIFGEDAVPVNFEKIKGGDRVFTRGEFALFLQESLNVLTYKVLP